MGGGGSATGADATATVGGCRGWLDTSSPLAVR